MKSVMMFSPNPTDATSFYRAVGPLQELKRRMDFQLLVGADVNWATLKGADVVFMQRPFNPNHVQIMDMAIDNGKPVWVDYDDDLFSVPRSNKTFRIYGNVNNQNNIAQILSKADVVTVSTKELQRKIREILKNVGEAAPDYEGLKLNPNKVVLVPNAYDEEFCWYRKAPAKPNQNKLITWRGSDTHDKDLLSVTNGIRGAFSRHLDWTMNFIGSPFWGTIEELQSIPGIKDTSVVETESVDPVQFWRMLWITAPALIMAPLWDCPFNRAKSNIAWIEGLHAGAITLAPDWEEWRRPGVLNYTSPKDFEEKLESIMRGEIDCKKMYEEGWAFIQEKLTLKKVNSIREDILAALFMGVIEKHLNV